MGEIQDEIETKIKKLAPVVKKTLSNDVPGSVSAFAQGNALNPIFKTGKHSEIQKYSTDEKDLDYYIDLGDINFISTNLNNLPMTLNDKKLFAALIKEFTAKNPYRSEDMNIVDENRYFDYPVSSFFDVVGYKKTENNKKEVAKLLKNSIEHLASYRIEVKERAIKKAKNKEITIEDFGTIPILGYVGTRTVTTQEQIDKKTIKINKGFIRLALSMELAKYLNIAPIGFIPDEITVTKNPVAFYLGYDFAVHYNTNKLHNHSNASIRKISSLLKDCRDIPSIQHVAETSRKYFDYIMKPFCEGAGRTQFVRHLDLQEKRIHRGIRSHPTHRLSPRRLLILQRIPYRILHAMLRPVHSENSEYAEFNFRG